MNRKPASPLSEFVRNASPEEKERVYSEAMQKASEQQRDVIDRLARNSTKQTLSGEDNDK